MRHLTLSRFDAVILLLGFIAIITGIAESKTNTILFWLVVIIFVGTLISFIARAFNEFFKDWYGDE